MTYLFSSVKLTLKAKKGGEKMAEIQGLVSCVVRDQYGIDSSVPLFVQIDDSKTIAQLNTDALAFRNDLNAITQGSVYKTTVTIFTDEIAPTDGAGDIEKGGLFNFNNGTDPYATGVWVPDINPSVLNSSGLIDLTNSDVVTFVTWLTTAHTVIQAVTKGVRALTSLRDALISFRKHRKPLERKTKETT